jgi:hypothetical protein
MKRNITRLHIFSLAIFTLVKDTVCGVLYLRVKKMKMKINSAHMIKDRTAAFTEYGTY